MYVNAGESLEESSLLGPMTDRKGQGAGADGPITGTSDLERQESLRRRGLRG